jgi:hypothetical protein
MVNIVFSMTKPVVAAAVMISVADYIPRLSQLDRNQN